MTQWIFFSFSEPLRDRAEVYSSDIDTEIVPSSIQVLQLTVLPWGLETEWYNVSCLLSFCISLSRVLDSCCMITNQWKSVFIYVTVRRLCPYSFKLYSYNSCLIIQPQSDSTSVSSAENLFGFRWIWLESSGRMYFSAVLYRGCRVAKLGIMNAL